MGYDESDPDPVHDAVAVHDFHYVCGFGARGVSCGVDDLHETATRNVFEGNRIRVLGGSGLRNSWVEIWGLDIDPVPQPDHEREIVRLLPHRGDDRRFPGANGPVRQEPRDTVRGVVGRRLGVAAADAHDRLYLAHPETARSRVDGDVFAVQSGFVVATASCIYGFERIGVSHVVRAGLPKYYFFVGFLFLMAMGNYSQAVLDVQQTAEEDGEEAAATTTDATVRPTTTRDDATERVPLT